MGGLRHPLLAAFVFRGGKRMTLAASPGPWWHRRGSASRWKKLARYSWRKPPPVATSRPTLGTPAMLDACADTIVALRLTGTLI
jgi:hypothetical protein